MENEYTEINVKIPRKYNKKKYLDAFAMGLFDLAVGERPSDEEDSIEEVVSVRIKLSQKGQKFWKSLLPKYEGNKRKLARDALFLIAQAPEHFLATRI